MNAGMVRSVRAVGVGSVLLALLAVVALASGHDRPRVSGSTDAELVAEIRDLALTVAVTLYAIGVVLVLWALWRFRERDLGPGPQLSIGSALVIALLASGLLWGVYHRPPPSQPEQLDLAFGPPQAQGQRQAQPRQAAKPLPPVQFRWHVAAGLTAAMVAAAGAALILRRRRLVEGDGLEPLSKREAAAAELAGVVDRTLDDLRREADPRRAVIAAYAQMERVLERSGLPREPSEAPFEYLARMLGELRVRAESALALTELFERARFSEHVIDAAMKDEAIDALVAVRDDLRRP